MRSSEEASRLEKFGGLVDEFRLWLTRAWRIGALMGRGGYFITERKRLFQVLGEEVYYRIQKGELHDPELEPMTRQIDRITKKLEIEEVLIRTQRFGRAGRKAGPADGATESE